MEYHNKWFSIFLEWDWQEWALGFQVSTHRLYLDLLPLQFMLIIQDYPPYVGN